jgi:hypothetical protein
MEGLGVRSGCVSEGSSYVDSNAHLIPEIRVGAFEAFTSY